MATGNMSGPGAINRPPRSKDDLRHDRIVAVIVLALVAALMALFVWLASLGGGAGGLYEPWMMP